MKHANSIKLLLVIVAALLYSCNSKDNAFFISDPDETESVTLKNDASVILKLGKYRITMDENNNFVSQDDNVAFFCYDRTEYLAAIDSLIPSGWFDALAVIPKYGYAVRLGKDGRDGYARLIVLDYTEDKHGITGAKIKFQYPWHPVNEETVVFSETDTKGIFYDPLTRDLKDCDKTTYRCYEVTISAYGYSSVTYVWMTEYDLVVELRSYAKYEPELSYLYRETLIKTEETCMSQQSY